MYRTILGSRIRSQLAYRTSFWLNVVTSVAVGVVEFIELYAILANVPVFGGLNLPQAALVFALAGRDSLWRRWSSASWTRCRPT